MGAVVGKLKKKPLLVTNQHDHAQVTHAGVGIDLDLEPKHPLPKGKHKVISKTEVFEPTKMVSTNIQTYTYFIQHAMKTFSGAVSTRVFVEVITLL